MKQLQAYLDQVNFARKLFNKPLYTVSNLTQADVDQLCAKINSDYSPENLTCDGELSRAQVQARLRTLNGAVKDLHAMGFNLTLEEV